MHQFKQDQKNENIQDSYKNITEHKRKIAVQVFCFVFFYTLAKFIEKMLPQSRNIPKQKHVELKK